MTDSDLVTVWNGATWRTFAPPPVEPARPREITPFVRAYLQAHPTYWMTPRDLATQIDAPRDVVADRLWHLWRIGVVDRAERTAPQRIGRPHRRYAYRLKAR